MTIPTVSVIMSAYRGAALVPETWASLAAQTFTDFELVVVDDCSPDDTLAILRAIDDPRVRVIASRANGGPVAARNRAFAEARGRYVAGLDQDDLCMPERLARQVAHLDAAPGTVLVAATAARLMPDGAVLPSRGPPHTSPALIDWLLGVRNPLAWSSTMFRREVAVAAAGGGAFSRQERLYAEDFDLYHRLRRHGRIARLDEPLILYREHDAGVSKTHRDRMIESTGVVLAEAHAALLGDEAPARARLLAAHVAARLPVPDAETFACVADTLRRVHRRFLGEHALDPREAARVDAQYGRLWWGVARAAVRSGRVPLARVLALRPAGMRISEASIADLLVSGVIGGGRALAGARRA